MNLWYEIGYTLRSIRRKIGFSVLCILVIVLGLSITLPLYSFAKNFVYTTLPYPDGHKLFTVRQIDSRTNSGPNGSNFDFYQFQTLIQTSGTVAELGAFYQASFTLSDSEFAQQFSGVHMTVNALEFTAVNPILGRTLSGSDELRGADPAVVIGYDVWQGYYAADPDIIGRTSRINGEPYSIVGVMPSGFRFPQAADIWLPLTIPVTPIAGEGQKISIVGKTIDDTSFGEATVELANAMQRIAGEYSGSDQFKTAEVVPFVQGFTNISLFKTLGGTAFCIYLLVGLNIGNLLLIRANERIHELMTRKALGAARLTLISHVLLESFVICAVGSLIGLLSASLILNSFEFIFAGVVPELLSQSFWLDFSFDAGIAAFATLMLTLLWLLSGGFAAWRTSKIGVSSMLAGGKQSTGIDSIGNRINRILVLTQVVISFFLLVISGSVVIAIADQTSESPIKDSDYFVTSEISLNTEKYENSEQRDLYITNLRRELDEIAEIESYTFASAYPGSTDNFARADLNAIQPGAEQNLPIVGVTWVDADYFQNLGLSLQQGRFFDSGDTQGSEAVAIANDAFVSQMNIQGDAIGRQVHVVALGTSVQADDNGQSLRVVGVVPSIGVSLSQRIFRPINQNKPQNLLLIAKTRSTDTNSHSDLELALRIAASSVDRDISLQQLQPLTRALNRENAAQAMVTTIFGSIALAALLLSAIGVYGLIARSVFTRMHEIGIRRAIGSTNLAIARIFLGQGTTNLLAGVVIGGGGSLLVLNALNSAALPVSLFSVLEIVFISVTCVFAALIFWASYAPVKKVVAMEPGEALHYE